jgi:hypothetical protein
MAKKNTRTAKKSAPQNDSVRLNSAYSRISNAIAEAKGSEKGKLNRQLAQLVASAPIVVRFTNRDFLFTQPKAARRHLRHSGFAVASIAERTTKGNQAIWLMKQKFEEGRSHITNAQYLKKHSKPAAKKAASPARRQVAAAATA